MMKEISWHDRWNSIIRDVVFPDETLKEQMLIPSASRKNIKVFIEKYFIEDALPDELVTDEDVRILYYETEGSSFGNPGIIQKYLEFDIFVKNNSLYNATNDRLQRRDKLILARLKHLLLGETYVCGLRFAYVDDYHLGVKTVGYRRYHAVFSYKQTY